MLDKIVVIPDSFKNTMESKEVAYIIKDKIKELNPEVEVLVYPIADGGEGTAVIFSEYLGLEIKKMKTTKTTVSVRYKAAGKYYEEMANIDFSQYNFMSEISNKTVSANGHQWSQG